MGPRFVLLLLLCICTVDAAKVTVSFKILASETGPTAQSVAEDLLTALQNGNLNVPYPIVNYTLLDYTSSPPDNQDEDSSGVSLSFQPLLMAALLSIFLFKNNNLRLIGAAVFGLSGAHALGYYDHCKLLDEDIQYKMHWRVDGDYINFAIQAQTDGWIATGISGDGHMDSAGQEPGSDIFLGHHGSACPNGCINDYSTVVYAMPKLDTLQNVQFVASSLEDGYLTIEYRRALTTGDTEHDRVISVNTVTHVLWAVNSVDPAPSSNSTFAKHNHRGAVDFSFGDASDCPGSPDDVPVEITFETSLDDFDQSGFISALASQFGIANERIVITNLAEEKDPFCPDCTVIEFKYPNYLVPAMETTYTCMGFNFPEGDDQHIIRFEVDVNNLQMLHHMILYQLPEGEPPFSSTPTLCNMPSSALPMFAWAPGANPVTLPQEAGFRIGGSSGVKYAVLNMHYNNPTAIAGQHDSSLVRMYLTKNLRENDAGFMFLGTDTGKIFVPGGEENWHMSGSCTKLVTSGLGSTVLNVFASMAHMHYAGRKLWTDHYRNDVYIGQMGDNLNYDFNSQHFNTISGTIQAGDELVTHCVWNTEGKDDIYGGEDSDQEMCLHAILYYPNINVGACVITQTSGCSCDYGQSCMNTSSCTSPMGNCALHTTCNSCEAASGCGWCDSPYIKQCLSDELEDGCNNINGNWNTCNQDIGTPCTQTHSDCGSCNADDANSCNWCAYASRPSDSFCLGGNVGVDRTVCQALGGVLRPDTC